MVVHLLAVILSIVLLGFITGSAAFALDVADVVRQWTAEGKKLAEERAKLPAHDEMVLIPAGEFLMGSDKRADRNAYQAELPQRTVYLDSYEIDRFEVTTVQFLKFILAHDLPPLIDWQYDGGNFQETMTNHPVMHVSWADAETYCKWAGKRNGRKPPEEKMDGCIPGEIRSQACHGPTLVGRACPVPYVIAQNDSCSIRRSSPLISMTMPSVHTVSSRCPVMWLNG